MQHLGVSHGFFFHHFVKTAQSEEEGKAHGQWQADLGVGLDEQLTKASLSNGSYHSHIG